MCEDTLGIQPRQGTGRRNGVHTAFKMLSPDKETQPGHSGIHLDVDPQRSTAFLRLCAVFLSLGHGGHRLCDVVGNELRHHFRRRVPQN